MSRRGVDVNQNGTRKTKSNTSHTAVQRLKRDFLLMCQDPIDYITVAPLPTNILEWHYVLQGPEHSPYAGGFYHGKLVFPPDYPFMPPAFYMITPNGRFETNKRLCLSISDFHPNTWNPSWNMSTILLGLISFMTENKITHGSIISTNEEKERLAKESIQFNLRDKQFEELFPDLVKVLKKSLKENEPRKMLRTSNSEMQLVPHESEKQDAPAPSSFWNKLQTVLSSFKFHFFLVLIIAIALYYFQNSEPIDFNSES